MQYARSTITLLPEQFHSSLAKSRHAFLLQHRATHFFVVHIPTEDDELRLGLTVTVGPHETTAPVRLERSPTAPIHFRTAFAEVPTLTTKRVEDMQPATLQKLLEDGCHFVVPLRKREGVDRLSDQRITIGRARNSDIVLRHGSVSKLHGWLEPLGDGTFNLLDAGSRNGTFLNGVRITPRENYPVRLGARIGLGSIESIVCGPELLWDATH